MAIFDDQLFQVSSPHELQLQQVHQDPMTSGDWWSLRREGDGYILEYISGEMTGRSKAIRINPDEAKRIISGEAKVEDVLIGHGAS